MMFRAVGVGVTQLSSTESDVHSPCLKPHTLSLQLKGNERSKMQTKDQVRKRALTLFQHANFEAFHEAAGLARLASPFGDLAFIGGRTAVLNIPCRRLGGKKILINSECM